uniref:CAZy families GT2 protein n=1 Tax=uncultured Lactobacillus sp. TaxID=153152 RepID=A0A060CQC4_9LACO|nr:CAZy families GT2 protein [uncultured Lactobacillus sp.]
MSDKLSIIVPCYNEEAAIPLFYQTVQKIKPQLKQVELEYWFINDGSSDNTLNELRKFESV